MRNSAGAGFYYTTDALGSVILLTDANQAKAATYSYDAWGNTTQSGAQAGNNPYQYVSGYKDAVTGFTKFGARYYNPAIGRFTQLDPSGKDPHYSYAGNNPITNSDPTGLSFLGEIVGEGLAAGISSIGSFGVGFVTKSTPIGIGAGLIIGCAAGAAGAAGAAVSSGSEDGSADGSEVAKGCGRGMVAGAVGGAFGGLLPKAFPK